MAEIDEPVHVTRYNPQWPQLFAAEASRIAAALPSGIRVEHIGSTSVPDLLAKPVIDIMIGRNDRAEEATIRRALRVLDYEDLGEAGVPDRLYFRRRAQHSFNVHVVLQDGPLWKSNIAIREFLHHNPAEARRYEEAKLSAVQGGATTLLAYSESKRPILSELISLALKQTNRPESAKIE